MTLQNHLRSAALALALVPLAGCIGASDDKLGSGNASKAGGSGIDSNYPINSTTQQNRDDKGDHQTGNSSDPNGIGRPNDTNATRTGGLGGKRDEQGPGPGETGPKASAGVASGPK